MQGHFLFSIGHGNKDIHAFLQELEQFNIEYLIDVRSRPYSRFHPQFNKKALEITMRELGIVYIFMGEQLGGLPDDPSCLSSGKVDYNKLKEKDYFKKGLERLAKAHSEGIRAAIMCSEGKPEQCHRTRLIGEELRIRGIKLMHIQRSKKEKNKILLSSQSEVMGYTDPGLFGKTDK